MWFGDVAGQMVHKFKNTRNSLGPQKSDWGTVLTGALGCDTVDPLSYATNCHDDFASRNCIERERAGGFLNADIRGKVSGTCEEIDFGHVIHKITH